MNIYVRICESIIQNLVKFLSKLRLMQAVTLPAAGWRREASGVVP